MALQAGEREVSLSSRGRAYTIDFTAMHQIDDDTGSPSKVLRQECDVARSSSAAGNVCKLPAVTERENFFITISHTVFLQYRYSER